MMNFFKRACLSLINRKAKNIMLIVLFTVVAVLILSGFCVRAAVSVSCMQIRRLLGSTVTLSADIDKADFNNINSFLVPESTAEEVARLKHVTACTMSAGDMAFASGFKPVGSAGSKDPNIYLEGISQSQNENGFKSKNSTLICGTHFFSGDSGKSCALIEKNLADCNKLKLGDRITLKSKSGKTQSFEITGIYSNRQIDRETDGQTKLQEMNSVIIPIEQYCRFNNTRLLIQADYELDDPMYIDSFRSQAKALKSVKGCKLDANDAAYLRMAGPLNSMNSIASIMVIVVVLAAAAMLSLIIAINMKSRRYEVGVLLSIGERRLKIVLQMAVEILITVLIGFTLSLAFGCLTADKIGELVAVSQKAAMEDTQNTATAVSKVNVVITSNEILFLYLAGVLIAVVSSSAPTASVMRYNPKDILTKAE